MSKLSPALKALIAAAHAKPNTLPASPQIRAAYESLWKDARSKGVGTPAWLCVSTAATMTMNSPDSMTELFKLATKDSRTSREVTNTAELMREVGLKCIGFNGVPRTINMLNAFRASLPSEIISSLSTTPTRTPTSANIDDIITRGNSLWDSIYHPLSEKLEAKLADAHPDLPVHILNHEYGALFADFPPPATSTEKLPKVGRVLTSIVAVSCLRSQTGVGPQVTSHVFGLRKAYEDGSAAKEEEIEGGKWLAGDEGNQWLLNGIDGLVEALGQGQGSSFAAGITKAKL